jgi:hypothetical protein
MARRYSHCIAGCYGGSLHPIRKVTIPYEIMLFASRRVYFVHDNAASISDISGTLAPSKARPVLYRSRQRYHKYGRLLRLNRLPKAVVQSRLHNLFLCSCQHALRPISSASTDIPSALNSEPKDYLRALLSGWERLQCCSRSLVIEMEVRPAAVSLYVKQ